MIPIICIYLPELPRRFQEAKAHLTSNGISPIWYAGFNGRLIGVRTANPHDTDFKNGAESLMHPIQVALGLTHMAVLSMAVAMGFDEFIVFEDDVVLTDGFESKWDAIRATIPESIGCVQLEWAESHKPLKKKDESPHALATGKFPFGAAAMWWRKDAAAQAVRMLRPINSPHDIAMIEKVFPFIGHAVVNPPLITQRTQQQEAQLDTWQSLQA